MIECIDVTRRYGHAEVLCGVNLTLREPGVYCLLGRNGAGKTTLLRSIAGRQRLTAGSVRVDGREVTPGSLAPDVSYVENFAGHYNLPVRKLLSVAGDLCPGYDRDFAAEMVQRFELDGRKRFRQLSLGMKTMLSTAICLASGWSAALLDEPVLGFDAIMRLEFYDMLTESIRRHPRILVVSTHLIEEIADAVHHLIVLDRGSVRFFEPMEAVRRCAFCVSGLRADVEAASAGQRVLSQQDVGDLATACIFGEPPAGDGVEVRPLTLQELFVCLVGGKGGAR